MKVPLYGGIHKGQRKWLFDIAIRAGKTEYSEQKDVDWLLQQLKALFEHMKEHAGLEEKFIHPILGTIVPGCHRALEADHKLQHQDLEDLINSLEKIKAMPRESAMLPAVGHEFYLGLNRFIYQYLKHIDYEEDHVQQILWNDCTPDELVAAFKKILEAQPQQDLTANLKLMLEAMNLAEIAGVLSMGKSLMPAPAVEKVMMLAEKTVEPERWAEVKKRLS